MTTPRTRHVYVRPPNLPTEHQGLLLRWERADDGSWWGYVVFVDRSGEPATTLVPADRLRPVESSPEIGSAYG